MPRPLQPRRGRAAGFTIIELIIVVAIIGILAAMMTGVISYVQNSAKRNTCLNNLRQWGGALKLYMADHNSKFPTYDANSLQSDTAWFNALPPYLEKSANTASFKDLDKAGKPLPFPGAGGKSLFLCPCDEGPEGGVGLGDESENRSYYSSYTMNTWVKSSENKPPLSERLRETQLRFPSAFVVLTETCHGREGGANLGSNLVDPDTRASAFRHNQSINLLFADGHSASFPRSAIWEDGLAEGDNKGGLQWNPNRGLDNKPLD